MRIATWNIASGRGSDGSTDLAGLAEAVRRVDADVLSLQEVDRGQERSSGADLTEIAAEAMGAEHRVFAPALYGTPGSSWHSAEHGEQDGPAYGCALISRLPLTDVEVVRMPAAPLALPLWVPERGPVVVREEPRVAVVAGVVVGTTELTLAATHLPFVPGWKHLQLSRLVRALRERPGPLVLMGDLNLGLGAATRVSGYVSLAQLPTFPAPRPRLQLDHLLARDLPGRVVAGSAPELPVSDHRALIADLNLF